MNNIPDLDGPEFGPATGGAPEQLVIFLHGYGADGNDLIGLAHHFADLMPGAKFVAPNAPHRCEGAMFGYQWFPLAERTEQEMLAGARHAQPVIDMFIDHRLRVTNLREKNLALIGFSQGTMVSLFNGLRREGQMAGILGYSGRLVGAEVLAAEIRVRPPVVLINGDGDELIPGNEQPKAVAALEGVGVPVVGHIRPGLGHSIDEVGVEIGRQFLACIFGLKIP
ncbi:MAG: phospholipase [Pseudomonadota bacterium]|nr:phospholipase [Pseudomonadota bacterium]